MGELRSTPRNNSYLPLYHMCSRVTPQGFVKSYQTLTVCRVILGFFGAGKEILRFTTLPALKVE
jgi:hypothetical protein